MAVRFEDTLVMADEREHIRPHIARLEALVRRFDPQAVFRLRIGHVPDYWELDAIVRPDLVSDEELGDALADEVTDILLDFDAAVLVIRSPRSDGSTQHRTSR